MCVSSLRWSHILWNNASDIGAEEDGKAVSIVKDITAPLTCKSWTSEEFWRDGVESRNVINSEILIFQASNTATKPWKFFAIAQDVTRRRAKKAIYGNTANLTLRMHSTWREITVAVLHQEKGNFLFGILRHLLILSNAFGGFFYFYVLSKFSKSSYK